jgi:hypothetical protein
LIQKTLVEKLSLASPMYDQGDQQETIQRLQARIQELEAAASSGGARAASETELNALRKQVSDQEGEILKLKELINAERHTNRSLAEELTKKSKMVEMMQQEVDKMVSPSEYDRLKLESERQIQLLQSRLEQQKQAVGNGGPQSDVMLAKVNCSFVPSSLWSPSTSSQPLVFILCRSRSASGLWKRTPRRTCTSASCKKRSIGSGDTRTQPSMIS